MRILFVSLLSCWATILLAAGPVASTISEVTVYRSGAKISRVATVKVPAGASEVVFENLSPYFNGNSLQVRIKGAAQLNAAVFQMKTPGPAPESPRIQVLRDSLVLFGDVFTRIRNEREILEEEGKLIRNNQSRVSTSIDGKKITLSVDELRALATYYRERLLEIKERRLQLDIQKRNLTKQQKLMNATLRKLQPNTANRTGEIVLKLNADRAQSIEIVCTYLVHNASWTPLYDLRSAGLNEPLELIYKANVRNQTGFDWKQVKLHLSTVQPLANNNRPILNPIFIDFRPAVVYREKKEMAKDEEVPVSAYQMEQINIRGARANPTNYYVDGLRVDGSPLNLEEDGGDFTANFDLDTPQDIQADGKENIVTIGEQKMSAEYEYHAVPKLESAVFLLAKVTDYGQYNLLPGVANVFFEETYVGQTRVDPRTTADTLLLSLGRDEQIQIKRVQPKDFKERRKIFGSKIRETYIYEISIKNNKGVPITVDLLDQVPISKQKDIVVKLEDRGKAKYDADFGKLEWQVDIPPGKNKKIRFSHSVERPKDKQVQFVRG